MNFDEQIAIKKEQKQRIVDQMEIKKEVFLDELSNFTSGWLEKETLSTIKENAEKVINLGEEKARELKTRIAQLKEKSPELVSQYLNKEHLWWHTNEDNVSYYSGNHKLLEKHDKQVRLLFGELGKILNEYGLVQGRSDYDRHHSSSWAYEDYDKKTIKYGYGLSYSRELYKITNEYIDLINQVKEVNGQIEKIEDQKKKENVEEWWVSL